MSDLNVCPTGWSVPMNIEGYGFYALSDFVQDSLGIELNLVGQELKQPGSWAGENGAGYFRFRQPRRHRQATMDRLSIWVIGHTSGARVWGIR